MKDYLFYFILNFNPAPFSIVSNISMWPKVETDSMKRSVIAGLCLHSKQFQVPRGAGVFRNEGNNKRTHARTKHGHTHTQVKYSVLPLISEKHVSPFQTVKEKRIHVFSFEAKHLPNKAMGEFCSFLNCQDKQLLLEITESSVSFISPLSEILPVKALTCLNCQYLLN